VTFRFASCGVSAFSSRRTDLEPGHVGRLLGRVGRVDLADDDELGANLEEGLRCGRSGDDRRMEDMVSDERGRVADGGGGDLLQLGRRALEQLGGGEGEGRQLCRCQLRSKSQAQLSSVALARTVRMRRGDRDSERTLSALPAQ